MVVQKMQKKVDLMIAERVDNIIKDTFPERTSYCILTQDEVMFGGESGNFRSGAEFSHKVCKSLDEAKLQVSLFPANYSSESSRIFRLR